MGSSRDELADWWSAVIPKHAYHRKLVLQAVRQSSSLLEAIWAGAELGQAPSCEARAGSAKNILSVFKYFRAWALSLSLQNGTLQLAGRRDLGVGGMVAEWTNHIGWELSRNVSWPAEFKCVGESQQFYLGQAFFAITFYQSIWPWLIDSTALATAARMPASVPDGVYLLDRPVAVLLYLLHHLEQEELVMAEVGVHKGETSKQLLEAVRGLRLVGVDPYPGMYGNEVSSERRDGMGSEQSYSVAKEIFAQFPERAELQRTTSLEAASVWPSRILFDLVFIDGEHDYTSCLQDIQAWAPLVRPGGILSGHDYRAAEPGVSRAVHQQVPMKKGAVLHLAPHSFWWWRVPG
eukprot:TRINITY_DN52176_c0_g1_i1.p1 TRINITY_DN52176_c0_g1~~TRINITY_DN52176_c0_g1_i1.p1  ORF type:complete len:349 (-),score=58.97 TRINITY_DN52176_c0_g1_i1:254-1300(-)